MDKVSIIIPVYNAEKYIRETIENIKEQSYNNWEIILVDDGSYDKSVEIINEYISDKIKLIKLDKNSGPAKARNIGITNATGKYLCFQDADDLWKADKLEKQIKYMEDNHIAFSYTGYYYTDENANIIKHVHIQEELDYKEALKNTRILTISVMFNLEIIKKEEIYMDEIENEDIATWWRILKNGYKAYGIDEPLVLYRRGHKSLTSNKFKNALKRWKTYRNIENLSIIKSIYYFMYYTINGVIKRI